MNRSYISILTLLLLWGAWLSPAKAQPANQVLIPAIESAESVFTTAIQAYEDRDYETAARLFGVAATTFDLHKKTTAALLMRGKSLYQYGDYPQTIQVLSQLIDTYPTSRFVAEARQVIEFANEGLGGVARDNEVINLGILLPMTENAAPFSQELFNGIKMAVDALNRSSYGSSGMAPRKVRMIFRDTKNNGDTAQQHIRDLATNQGVDAIIGPLFSSEAVAAAEEAQRSGIVMITPLATEESVSRNRNYVFQANPTIAMRGRLMARFAVRGLGLKKLGIITDYNNAESRRMARGFEQEMEVLGSEIAGAEVAFNQFLSDTRTWFRLSDGIPRDSLLKADAIYLPINGGNAQTLIGGVLSSLDRMGLGNRVRLLGNVEWHNLPMVTLASNFTTTYTNDFYVNPADSTVLQFAGDYLAINGKEPEQLAYRGYDVAHFLGMQLQRHAIDPRPLDQMIRDAGNYRGMGTRLDFTNGNVNEAVFYHRYREGTAELLR